MRSRCFVFLVLAQSGCLSPSQYDDDYERNAVDAPAWVSIEPPEQDDASDNEDFEDPLEQSSLPADVAEEGFCSDDIYSSYLKGQYFQSIKGKPNSDTEHEAHSFARHHLVGPTAPYFGAIPIVANEHVDRWVQYFKTSGRREFIKWLVRGESVRHMVQPILQDKGIPIEFFYLAMIESGFSNRASSTKRATGTWQFMPSTAGNYGLTINHWVDERRDPIKSTVAAANYLRDLYDQLGDWYLTMAAYNAGPGRLRRAIRRARSRDFWQIAKTPYLARETKSYVPKVLAAILLASDARNHGFEVKEAANDWIIPETEVIVQRPIRLSELAIQLKVPLKALRAWNPELIQNVTPPGRSTYALRLAAHLAMRYPEVEGRLSRLNIADVQLHTVKDGETLRAIAQRYKVGVKDILSLNPKLKPQRLRIGNTVAVPIPQISAMPPEKA